MISCAVRTKLFLLLNDQRSCSFTVVYHYCVIIPTDQGPELNPLSTSVANHLQHDKLTLL
jgi:hypothetical protein